MHECGHDLVQSLAVGVAEQGLIGAGQGERDRPGRLHHTRVGHHVGEHGADVGGFELQLHAPVEVGEQQQVVDDRAHPF